MKLGPKQKEWIDWIRKNEQYKCCNQLGRFNPNNQLIECCILGSLLYTTVDQKINIIDFDYSLIDSSLEKTEGVESICYLKHSFEELGLYDPQGSFFNKTLVFYDKEANSLSEANDDLIPWSIIADFVEEYPEAVFTKSY